MKTFGIICAMDEEIKELKDALENEEEITTVPPYRPSPGCPVQEFPLTVHPAG